MAKYNGQGLEGLARAVGLKRRFFGLESDESLASRIFTELEKLNPITQLCEGLSKAFEPRYCEREEYFEADGMYTDLGGRQHSYIVKEWVFHYSDGTEEAVTVREPTL